MKDLKLTATSLSYIIQELGKLDTLNKAYRVKVSDWKEKRTLTANGLIHVFVKSISDFTSTDIKTVKQECKIDFGLPIILARGDEYSKVVDYILNKSGFYRMSREQQVKFITAIAVTSKFTTEESKVFLDNMIHYWQDKGLDIGYQTNNN